MKLLRRSALVGEPLFGRASCRRVLLRVRTLALKLLLELRGADVVLRLLAPLVGHAVQALRVHPYRDASRRNQIATTTTIAMTIPVLITSPSCRPTTDTSPKSAGKTDRFP